MILNRIVEDKKIRLKEHKARVSPLTMRDEAERIIGNGKINEHLFLNNLKKESISIIGEFKKASPSLGRIEEKIDLLSRIDEYNAAVDAISCLTEEDHFDGNTGYLKTIRERTGLPILRKDFMIDEYQFYEARVIGADAVLLIVAILDDERLKSFYQLSKDLKLDVLVETHDEYEIERALRIDPDIVGINNRNLKDFSITLENTSRLKRYIPDDKVLVSESGIMEDKDVKYLKDIGVDAFLIGRAFMENANPRELARKWKEL